MRRKRTIYSVVLQKIRKTLHVVATLSKTPLLLVVIEIFATQPLADTLDLHAQVKQAHWNVKGMNFYQLHLLFDQLATELQGFVDLIAERVTTLGGIAIGTVRIAA